MNGSLFFVVLLLNFVICVNFIAVKYELKFIEKVPYKGYPAIFFFEGG